MVHGLTGVIAASKNLAQPSLERFVFFRAFRGQKIFMIPAF
jgi:hypothetical protein